MADDKKFDLGGVFGDVINTVAQAVNQTADNTINRKPTKQKKVTSIAGIPLPGSTTTKKSTTKKSTSKKSTSSKSSAVDKAIAAGASAAKKANTTKSSSSKTAAKKTTTTKKKTSSKAGKIMLEINGRQIDFKTIESKAAKLGGDCYVVVNEKKIYNEDGKSVSLY